MNSQVSNDFERLSAYIDNQLSAAEKAELEQRLAKEPELQAGLSDLRRTIRALRSLPTVKPPRSFTLRPEQVGAGARRSPLFPVLRLATALCTLLLAVAVARDFTAGGLTASAPYNYSAQSGGATGGAATALVAPNAAVRLTPTPAAIDSSISASAPNSTVTAEPHLATTPFARMSAVEPSATPTGGEQQPTTAGPTIKNFVPSETPTGQNPGSGAEGSGTAAASPSAAASNTPVSVAALPPAATQAMAPSPAPLTQAQGPSGLRLAEIVLAVLALALGAAAWLKRRG